MLVGCIIAQIICENKMAERELEKLNIILSQNTSRDKNKETLSHSINSSTTYSEVIVECEEKDDVEDSYGWQWKKSHLLSETLFFSKN
jgi:predicted component of viral defense system (DUF524 family)